MGMRQLDSPAIDGPLCVDLDGTLVRGDTMVESGLGTLRASPLNWLRVPYWLLRGRARLKGELARRGRLDVATLPYRSEILSHLQAEHARGRRLVLATAAHITIADAVAKHLGLFSEVVATDGAANLTGQAKADALVARFGERGFAYAGNERRDLAIWRRANEAIVVDCGRGLIAEVAATTPVRLVVGGDGQQLAALVRALRPHQWLKNVLVLVPPLAAHVSDGAAWAGAVLTAVAWCLAASCVYLVNDLFDLHADRVHRDKRSRPLASGSLSPFVGLAATPVLAAGALALAWLAAPAAALALAAYWCVAMAYSGLLKTLPWVDTVVLAGLFVLRLVGGGAGSGCPVSPWLLGFAGALFLGLAFAKRAGELAHQGPSPRRGYRLGDLTALAVAGIVSGAVAVAVFAGYAHSAIAASLYHTPSLLLLDAAVLALWLARVWTLALRGCLHHDPLVHACRDPWSWLALAVGVAAFIAASAGWPA